MRRAKLLTVLVAAALAVFSAASHAGGSCRVESDIVRSYHHMLARAVGPWLEETEPPKSLGWNDWLPAEARDVCNFMEVRRDIELDRPQEGRAVDEPAL